ncbi:MAG TPA: putative Ig domain-containing protein [Acidimicrobiales bacterium]
MNRHRVHRASVGLPRRWLQKRWRVAVLVAMSALSFAVVGSSMVSIAGAATVNVTSFTISSSTPVYGATNTYSVTLVVPMTDPAPTGTVTVTDPTPRTCSITTFTPSGDGVTYTGSCAIAAEDTVGTVSASFAGDTNYNPASSSNSVTIGKANQSNLTVTSTSVNYNATATTLPLVTSGGLGAGAVTYAFTAGTAGCSVTGTTLSATSAGTCTVTATKAADTDYNAVSSVATTVTVATIAQAALVVSSIAVNYDPTATTLPLTTTGGSGTGAITFVGTAGTAGCSVSGTTLSATSAGTCTVTATKAASTDYSAISSVATTVTVNPIAQAALTVTSTAGTYNTPLTLATTGGSGSGALTYAVTAGTAGCSITSGVLIAARAGTCTVTATLAASTDYTAISSAATTITIAEIAQAPLTITSTSGTINTALALGATGGSDGGAITYVLNAAGTANCSISSGVLSASTAGTCTVTATMAGNADYNAVSSPQTTITIAKTNQAVLSITSTSGVYNSSLTLTSSGGSDGGAVTYSLSSAGTADCSITNGVLIATSAGTCSVVATMAGNNNYNAVSSSTTTITISKTSQPAAISAVAVAHFTALSAGSLTLQVVGTPSPVLSFKGSLPAGLRLTNNGSGTATISGFTALLALGTHHLTLVASNGVGSGAIRSLEIVVGFAPVVFTPPTATFVAGSKDRFVVTSAGYPAGSVTESGTLPAGVRFAQSGNGTATLAGVPSVTDRGSYDFSIIAKNVFGTRSQAFTLVVGAVPAFSSPGYASFKIGTPTVFRVAAGGSPLPTITEAGTLPVGMRFVGGRGAGTLSGTPAKGSSGTYRITFTAGRGSNFRATQTFTLVVAATPSVSHPTVTHPTVGQPTFSSADKTTFVVGDATVFVVAAKGKPLPSVTERGTLPVGVSFQGGSGTGILSGTPAKGTSGVYRVTLTAGKGSASSASETFTLTISST